MAEKKRNITSSLLCILRNIQWNAEYNTYIKNAEQCKCRIIIRRIRITIVGVEKKQYYIFHVSVPIFFKQLKRIRCIIISSVVYHALLYNSTLSIEDNIFKKCYWTYKMCHKDIVFFFFRTFSIVQQIYKHKKHYVSEAGFASVFKEKSHNMLDP
jgi:hypothetical protein